MHVWHQVINNLNQCFISIRPWEQIKNSFKIKSKFFKKMHWKMPSTQSWPFCSNLNESNMSLTQPAVFSLWKIACVSMQLMFCSVLKINFISSHLISLSYILFSILFHLSSHFSAIPSCCIAGTEIPNYGRTSTSSYPEWRPSSTTWNKHTLVLAYLHLILMYPLPRITYTLSRPTPTQKQMTIQKWSPKYM